MPLEKGIAELVAGFIAAGRPLLANRILMTGGRLHRQHDAGRRNRNPRPG